MANISGINESKMETLILDIVDYAEEILKNYNLLEQVVDKILHSFKGDNAVNFKNYFSSMSQNFETINLNILSYKNDLCLVRRNYHNVIDKMITEINQKESKGGKK